MSPFLMKTINVVGTFAILTSAVFAQNKLPIIKSNSQTVSIQDGEKLKKNGWNLVPEAKPDVYEAELIDGKPHQVTFITDVDKISFTVEENKKYDFIIEWNDQKCETQIVGTRFVPAVRFDKKYQVENKGKISARIPEVYELVNVAIAMTSTGIANADLVYQKSDYYKSVRRWFDKYQNHGLLAALDAELKKNPSRYFDLKTNGYAFEFDENGKIVNSKVFDRISWDRTNMLRSFLTELQSFSDETDFRKFYNQNRKTYDEQIAFFQNAADIGEMKKWLDKNFPTSNNYDYYNVIFSPLVAYNQSSIWFESNNFKELQPHINFPYVEDLKGRAKLGNLSEKAENVRRGNIVFTEINHGYINPEAEKYAERAAKAISNRDFWLNKSDITKGYPGIAAFNEYMNWGLVSLRFVDYAPREEQDKLIAAVDQMMLRRGFRQFVAFDKFLVNLYRNRQPNQTVADLYPQIIEWFEKNNQ